MRLIPLVLTLLGDAILWDYKKINCFNLISKKSSNCFRRLNISSNSAYRNKITRQNCENEKVKSEHNKLHVSHYNDIIPRKKYETDVKLEDQVKNISKDIQGVWKFYFPLFIMDTEFEAAKGESGEIEKLGRAAPLDSPNDLDDLDEADTSDDFRTGSLESNQRDSPNVKSTSEEESDDTNLNLLRGERMYPLSMFVYNCEKIVSGSTSTYAYWSNKFLRNNIFECTVKFINKMNSKYMIILQGYLFISKINALNDKNIRLMPCQIYGNLFLANNDNAADVSLIPRNMKVYDKNGKEVKDILTILEKKIPGFRTDKKKIDSFLALKKWKFLGVSTAYKIVGEGKNMFNINHFLTGKDESLFYNIMDFDTVNTNYNKNGFVHMTEIFNSYFEKPPTDVLSLIMKNLEEKSINGPF
ncbi:hypothetical protein, conserved [Plasmodium gonderi]|uniref:Uncharacterized protein n=1 Tax=Plasmodium gonderi TaxID=77519 RepID=A0A1Y1JEJ2_PLAGO|nr:hypothetical protein, conserved [Plasmodium gonderi]GAW79172.1 hypothetical protein, conserved [Plasmodium gonderi]